MEHFKFPDKLPPAVAALLAACDEIRYDHQMPSAAATALIEGHLTLLLGKLFVQARPDIQREILKHETAHFYLGHLPRRGDRENLPWNLCCDSSLHHTDCCDWQAVEEHLTEISGEPHQLVTFDRLGIPPMPPEFAYDLLPRKNVMVSGGADGKGGGTEHGEACGSMGDSTNDGSIESRLKAAGTQLKIGAEDPDFVKSITGGRLGGVGTGSRPVPDIAPPPKWIRGAIDYLTHTVLRSERRRSWMREHRNMPDVLPGLSRKHAKKARILIDASGSIDEETLRVFLGAICGTPELQYSDAVVFDSAWSEPIPVSRPGDIVAAVKAKGGGTAIKATGEACREPGVTAVWLTDGYTGDGWPTEHTTYEVWCITSSDVTPPHGVTIRAPIGESK